MTDLLAGSPPASVPDAVAVPGATVGIVGGGQLGRMAAEAASPLGIEIVVLDPTPDCPAVPPATEQIVGEFDDTAAMTELAGRADALTVEIELADPDAIATAGADAGVPVHPTPETLRTVRDKLLEKRRLADAGLPVPSFRGVDDAADLRSAFEELGRPLMLKARRGGYDGRGTAVVESVTDAEQAFGELRGTVAESLVEFARELSVIGVVGADETRTYPVTETVHEAEILRQTVTPARTTATVRKQAQRVATEVLTMLSGRGVYGIELFETTDGKILVNEIAPRPHNSGHYTIEGAVTSQFEQHVRAVLGLPVGGTELRCPTAVGNLLGDTDQERLLTHGNRSGNGQSAGSPASQPADAAVATGPDSTGLDSGTTPTAAIEGTAQILTAPDTAFHWYGKRTVRPLRKMGHLTVVGEAGALDDEHTGDDTAEPATRVGPRSNRGGSRLDPTELLERASELTDAVRFTPVTEQ
jgi:phosphoribosylaminoimidazole carboxylase (EC 4.1.1.21)